MPFALEAVNPQSHDSDSYLHTISTSFFSDFRIFSRGIVLPYRLSPGPTSKFRLLPSIICLIIPTLSRLSLSKAAFPLPNS